MKRPKHPPHADVSQLAKSIVDAATSETEELAAAESAAVKRGRKGGESRAEQMSAQQRADIAKKAAAARWRKSR